MLRLALASRWVLGPYVVEGLAVQDQRGLRPHDRDLHASVPAAVRAEHMTSGSFLPGCTEPGLRGPHRSESVPVRERARSGSQRGIGQTNTAATHRQRRPGTALGHRVSMRFMSCSLMQVGHERLQPADPARPSQRSASRLLGCANRERPQAPPRSSLARAPQLHHLPATCNRAACKCRRPSAPAPQSCSSRTQIGVAPGTVDDARHPCKSDHRHDRAGHAAQ